MLLQAMAAALRNPDKIRRTIAETRTAGVGGFRFQYRAEGVEVMTGNDHEAGRHSVDELAVTMVDDVIEVERPRLVRRAEGARVVMHAVA